MVPRTLMAQIEELFAEYKREVVRVLEAEFQPSEIVPPKRAVAASKAKAKPGRQAARSRSLSRKGA